MRYRTLFVGLLVILLGSYIVPAAQVARFSLEDLINHSQFIVHGRVSRTWESWDSGHRYIWTHHEIAVSDVLAGVLPESVTVSEPGGSLDGIHQSFSGELRYSAGEELVVFLYRTPIGFLRAAGGGQGKFSVGADGRIHSNLAGVELVDSLPRRGTPLRTLESLSLSTFKQRIRNALQTSRE